MPTATPIAVRQARPRRGQVRRRRPGAGHRAGGGHRRGADDGLDEPRPPCARPSRRAARCSGAARRQEVWRKGDTSGDRQFVREASYDCDGDTLLFVVEQEGSGRLPHRRPHLLLPGLRRSGRRRSASDPPEPGRVPGPGPATTPSSRCGASCSPTSSRRSPPSPGCARRRARASCSSRSSTASAGAAGPSSGREPRATLVARGRAPRGRPAGRLPDGIPLDQGVLAAVEALLGRVPRRRRSTELPPLHGGLVGYLGYDVVREVEHLPDVARRTTSGCPTRSSRSSASWPPSTTGASGSRCIANAFVPRRRRREADARRRLRRGRGAARRSWPPTVPGRSTSRCSTRPTPTTRCPTSRSTMWRGRYEAAVEVGPRAHPRRRHLPGRAGPALRPRPRRRPVRRLPGAAPGEPEPVHVLRAPPRGHAWSARRPSRWCSCSTAG